MGEGGLSAKVAGVSEGASLSGLGAVEGSLMPGESVTGWESGIGGPSARLYVMPSGDWGWLMGMRASSGRLEGAKGMSWEGATWG